MDRGSYSNHVAHMLNAQERRRLEKESKFWDKCKEDRSSSITREEKEFVDLLKHLKHDRKETVPRNSSRKSIDLGGTHSRGNVCTGKTRRNSGSGKHHKHQVSDWVHDTKDKSPLDAHNVALRMLDDRSGQKWRPHADDTSHKESAKVRRASMFPTATLESSANRNSHQGGLKLPEIGTGNKNRRNTLGHVQNMDSDSSLSNSEFPNLSRRRNTISVHSTGNTENEENGEKLDMETMIHYQQLLADTETQLQHDDSLNHQSTQSGYGPTFSLKRSQRRKLVALENLLKKMSTFKDNPEFKPQEMLNCSYLRLSRNNIETLENLCREEGYDPKIHIHMTKSQVERYFDQQDEDLIPPKPDPGVKSSGNSVQSVHSVTSKESAGRTHYKE